mmetsp:Transcript_11593/g.27810  ORF Transcript_11593/g.27810 Transcript_11593/m.27810 type:complete len:278 (-) Transcript_11593:383-1216(-)
MMALAAAVMRFPISSFSHPPPVTFAAASSFGSGTSAGAGTERSSSPCHAEALTGRSSAAFSSPSRTMTEREKPFMSSAVSSGPEMNRTTLRPLPSMLESARRPMSESSIGVALPRELTSSATSAPLAAATYGCPSPPTAGSRMAPTAMSTSESQVCISLCFAPGSPWIPSPISIVLSSRRSFLGWPGNVHVPSATPMLPTAAFALRAASATSLSDLPAAAAAPATLCTSTVPATPRRPVMPLSLGSAQSSATTTISHGMPAALAFSRAMPKLSLSPV